MASAGSAGRGVARRLGVNQSTVLRRLGRAHVQDPLSQDGSEPRPEPAPEPDTEEKPQLTALEPREQPGPRSRKRWRSPRDPRRPGSCGRWTRTWPRRWMHSHAAPSADCRDQNSWSWGLGSSIRRPFMRPVRVRTARSSPRFTRSNMVWRETPRARVAWWMATQRGCRRRACRAAGW